MKVALKLGPADHGRPVELDDFMAADYQEGYQYELIDGKLYVSPQPNPPQDRLDIWLLTHMLLYSKEHPEVINYATNRGRVFVPGRPGVTTPEPDLSAYSDYPLDLPFSQLDWRKLRPMIVAEVISCDDPDKDLVRNVELYLQVPSIKEYWALDGRSDPEHPTMRVHRRRGDKWKEIDLAFGETYTTKLLPGFELKIDPRS